MIYGPFPDELKRRSKKKVNRGTCPVWQKLEEGVRKGEGGGEKRMRGGGLGRAWREPILSKKFRKGP